jgi:pilus assembly protein Flp/PilA
MLNELSARIMTWAATARDEEGQGLVEYALILALVSVASILVLTAVGGSVGDVLQAADDALQGAI